MINRHQHKLYCPIYWTPNEYNVYCKGNTFVQEVME